MTAEQFYFAVWFGVFVDHPVKPAGSLAQMASKEECEWLDFRGKRFGHWLEDGWIVVAVDLGDRVICARRTQSKTLKWLDPKPRVADQMMLTLLLSDYLARAA